MSGLPGIRGEPILHVSRRLFHLFISIFAIRQHDVTHRSCVAVKILSTHATQVQGRLANELDILERVASCAQAHPGRKHVATLLDKFTVTDHHGPHLCLVFEALGAFNGSIYVPGRHLPVTLVKNVSRQLLLALDFLHRECQIVHTGKIVLHTLLSCLTTAPISLKDLKPDNILITLPDAEETIRRYTAEASQSEQTGGLATVTESSLPLILSRPIIPFNPDDLQNINSIQSKYKIQLTDFGTGKQRRRDFFTTVDLI